MTYVERVLEIVKSRNPAEPEFLQAVEEVLNSLSPVLDRYPDYEEESILERIVEPERVITFRVPWMDDKGGCKVNRGVRVEFNSAIGPYKGGLRFHPSVNLGILKFLGFEQVFKNSLTTLSMGGGKGGSDFDPKGKSNGEIMRFCQSFMSELFRYIGPNRDIPAGDIGVGAREIGYLFGQYKRLANEFSGVLTGKDRGWGGSVLRPEATGFGNVYFAEEMLRAENNSLEGKTAIVSGFGNVAWGTVLKLIEFGAKVVTISGPDGYVYVPTGLTDEMADYMLELRATNNDIVKPFAKEFNVEFIQDKKVWEVKCDVAFPSATQNEIDHNDAKALIDNGCILLSEGANMPTSIKGIKIFQDSGILYGPSKAANAGGVAVSGLEMAQNSSRISWIESEVDAMLKRIMKDIYTSVSEYAEEFDNKGNFLFGANTAGFIKVADAMLDQGIV